MLYLSLILIASGLFFIIYTLIVKARKETGTNFTKVSSNRQNAYKEAEPKNREKITAEKTDRNFQDNEQNNITERTDAYTGGAAGAGTQGDDSFADAEKVADNMVYGTEDMPVEEGMSENTPVVMFEDSSNIIDYGNNDSIIDSTLKEYKKIRRVGAGNFDLSDDGINFRVGKRLYRFDFRRITDIKSGGNFIVLKMQGSSDLKLFLFKKDTSLSDKLKKIYHKYSANVL